MEDTMAPQNFLYGCKLEAGKEVVFNPQEDDFEHQLDLRMACVDATTKDELHMVEVEGQDEEGQKVMAVLASLKPSTLPSVCLGGFTITPPTVFRLKAGSGPIHISGQHLVIMEAEQSFDDGEEEEEEEDEDVPASKKRPASSPVAKNQKKLKKGSEADEEDDDDDEEEDDDDDDDMEESPVPVKPKAKTPAQNGKGSKPTTPSKNQPKTPNKDGKSPRTPKTPKKTPTVGEVKEQLTEFIKKGRVLPKIQAKFENLMKNGYKVTDTTAIEELWKWKQSLKE